MGSTNVNSNTKENEAAGFIAKLSKVKSGYRCNFIGRLVTQDETWIHHFDPETKQQSKQWVRCV